MPEYGNHAPFRVALVTMPFAAAHLPSIALTQLKSALERRFGDDVASDVHYLNLDFVEYLGSPRYRRISDSVQATSSGLGEWLFRRIAFPELPDNSAEYLQRYGRALESHEELLRSPDVSAESLDCFLDELIERHALDACDLVGFSSMFAQNVPTFALARKLKQRRPEIVTAIGGANCETTMGRVIARHVAAIDFVFSGPALKTFPDFVEFLRDENPEACHSITGVYSRQKLDRAGAVDEIGAELGLEHVLPLDYTGFIEYLEQKSPGVAPSLLFETSRGCWWGERSHCTFCGLNGTTMKYRSMEPAQALAQFDELFAYAPTVTRFESVDNILPRQYLKSVLPRLNPPTNARIFYEIKADLKDHEMEVLANAGVTELQPGIEALNSSTLKLMRKGTSSFHNIRFLKNCLVYGIEPVWNLLVGFPGEAECVYETYVDVLPSLTHLPPPSGCYPVRFDRYSPYHTMADSYGLKLEPYDFYSLVYPFPAEDLGDFAYFFSDTNSDNPYVATTARWLNRLERATGEWKQRWQQSDEAPRLTVEWRGDCRVVCDSRSGQLAEHELDPTAFDILSELRRPLSAKRLAARFDSLGESTFAERIESLRSLDLLFEDDGQYMSLVTELKVEQGYL